MKIAQIQFHKNAPQDQPAIPGGTSFEAAGGEGEGDERVGLVAIGKELGPTRASESEVGDRGGVGAVEELAALDAEGLDPDRGPQSHPPVSGDDDARVGHWMVVG